jgi:long-chain acyl-CoA synthetase
VGVVLPNCAHFVAAVLGTAMLGRTAILFPVSLTDSELRAYCQMSGTHVLIARSDYSHLLQRAGGRLLSRKRSDLEIYLVEAPSQSHVRQGDFIGQLTSGVDKAPKVAVRTHGAVWTEVQDFAETIGLTARDATLVLPAISHSYGLIGGTLAPLCYGAHVVLGERLGPEDVLRIAETAHPTILFAVPLMYRSLTAAQRGQTECFSSLRLCFSAGAPLPRDVDDRFAEWYGRRICQDYGCTEAGVISVRLEWTPRLARSVGRPIPNRVVTIVDDYGRPVPRGQVGEVILESPVVARCYLETVPRGPTLIQGDRLSTGDLGWMDDDGYLFLTGRRSSRVQIAGAAVDLAEVEAVISELEGVREAAVVGIPGASHADQLKAVVVAEGLTAMDIDKHCRRYLTAVQVPQIIEFRETIPRTPAGKILRRALREEPPTGS